MLLCEFIKQPKKVDTRLSFSFLQYSLLCWVSESDSRTNIYHAWTHTWMIQMLGHFSFLYQCNDLPLQPCGPRTHLLLTKNQSPSVSEQLFSWGWIKVSTDLVCSWFLCGFIIKKCCNCKSLWELVSKFHAFGLNGFCFCIKSCTARFYGCISLVMDRIQALSKPGPIYDQECGTNNYNWVSCSRNKPMSNWAQIQLSLLFFFGEKHTHTRKRKRCSNIKTHYNLCNTIIFLVLKYK